MASNKIRLKLQKNQQYRLFIFRTSIFPSKKDYYLSDFFNSDYFISDHIFSLKILKTIVSDGAQVTLNETDSLFLQLNQNVKTEIFSQFINSLQNV